MVKNTLYLTTEIGMARRIDNVDFCILIKYSGIFGQDSDTTLTLDIVGIHDTFLNGLIFTEYAALL